MTQFEDLPATVVGHILSKCNLQTIGRAARVNRFFRDRVVSSSSLALAEKFSVGDFARLKTIITKLPSYIQTKLRNDTLSLEDALNAILPPYYLYQIEHYALSFKKAGQSLEDVVVGLSRYRNAFDHAAEQADLCIFNSVYDDGAPADVVILLICDYLNLLNPNQANSLWTSQLLPKPKIVEKTGTKLSPAMLVRSSIEEHETKIMAAIKAHLPEELKEAIEGQFEIEQTEVLLFLCSPAAHYAVVKGKLTPASMTLSKEDWLLTMVNANLPEHRQLENWSNDLLPFLIEKNTLLALARNLVQITDFADLSDVMRTYMRLALTDLGMSLLEEAGSFAALRVLAPTQLQLLSAMYDEEIIYENPNPICGNHVYMPYIGTFETKQCVKEKLISLHDLVKYEGYFSLWYLLLSELGMKCLRAKTLTLESALKLEPPSKLAQKILELNCSPQAVVACNSNDDDNEVCLLNNRHT